MNKTILTLLLLLPFTNSYSAKYPDTAIFTTVTDNSGVKVESETLIKFSKNEKDSLTAEWTRENIFGRVKNSFNLTKDGTIYHVDLDTNECTKTDIKELTDKINDPESVAKQMRQELNLNPAGNCPHLGHKGNLYTNSFLEICLLLDVLTLWQKNPAGTSEMTALRLNVPLPENKTTLPAGLNCVAGPDMSKGIGGMMNYGQSKSAAEQDNSQSNTSGGSTNQQQPSQEEMQKMQKQANEMMKNLGKSLEGLFPQQE